MITPYSVKVLEQDENLVVHAMGALTDAHIPGAVANLFALIEPEKFGRHEWVPLPDEQLAGVQCDQITVRVRRQYDIVTDTYRTTFEIACKA